ncbi:MAG: hypothetical protein WC498_04090 [Candidatus Saccharimonadales bacterium]
MKPAAKTILWGQLCLLVGLALCAIIRPEGLTTNNGISYYGIFHQTVVPYMLGLLGAAYFCSRAADKLPSPLNTALRISALLIVGIVVTPYAVASWVDYLHTAFGSALFSLQLVLSGWVVWKLKLPWWGIVLFAIEFGAGVLSASYLNPTSGFLIQSQAIFQFAFGTLLVLGLQKLTLDKTPSTN